MTQLTPLAPAFATDVLFPDNAVFAARSDLHQTRLLGFTALNVDAVTTLMLGLLGPLSTVRHQCCATDEILSCLAAAALRINEDMHLYETRDQAEAIADMLIGQGKQLFSSYPLREGRFSDAAHVVPPDLWRRLNSKEHLTDLAPTGAVPNRRRLSVADLGPDLSVRPAYLKAAGDAATGWGYAVRYVQTDADIDGAREDFRRHGVDQVLVEEAIEVETCWCASLGVVDAGVTYLGAAEQTFSAPARQLGSVIDPDNPLPDCGISLAKDIAKAAWRKGFRGICGFDIGLSHDGHPWVFDPNFRFNSSTPQVLFHPAASGRSTLAVSASFGGQSLRPMSDVIAIINGPIADGWFVPSRLLDASLLEAAQGTHLITGLVLGATRAAAQARATELSAMLA